MNRPSLYAAFGDKETLFLQVLDRYTDSPASYVQEALNAPTARTVIERLLQGALDLLTHPHHPHGCLLVQGGLACSKATESIQQELALRRATGEAAIRQRFERAKLDGDLPANSDLLLISLQRLMPGWLCKQQPEQVGMSYNESLRWHYKPV